MLKSMLILYFDQSCLVSVRNMDMSYLILNIRGIDSGSFTYLSEAHGSTSWIDHCVCTVQTHSSISAINVCVCARVCVRGSARVWTKEEKYMHKIPLRGAVPLGGAPLEGNCLKPLELCKIRSCVE